MKARSTGIMLKEARLPHAFRQRSPAVCSEAASASFRSSNRLVGWLRGMSTLRRVIVTAA
jgi:hypothetical protein